MVVGNRKNREVGSMMSPRVETLGSVRFGSKAWLTTCHLWDMR